MYQTTPQADTCGPVTLFWLQLIRVDWEGIPNAHSYHPSPSIKTDTNKIGVESSIEACSALISQEVSFYLSARSPVQGREPVEDNIQLGVKTSRFQMVAGASNF